MFHNGSNYDYHLRIKKLAEGSERQFECLGENTEKYKTFFLTIKKETENNKTITNKIKLVDTVRFMLMYKTKVCRTRQNYATQIWTFS